MGGDEVNTIHMKIRVYIIHGWDDNPHNGWFPWLKNKLENAGAEVHVPSMPDAAHPAIDVWVPFLKHLVGDVDAHTFFIGHSIGCQTILRYLQTLPAGVKVGGVVLVAGWMTLKAAAIEDDDTAAVARPWLQRPIDWAKVRSHVGQVVAVMSDTDPYVAVENAVVFRRELKAQVIMEHDRGHLSGVDGISRVASIWESVRQQIS